jgi:hypothetical protein
MILSGDHYCVEEIAGGCQITIINDDPEDFPGDRNASVWQLKEVDRSLRTVGRGKFNTNQTLKVYAESQSRKDRFSNVYTNEYPVIVADWSEFVFPSEALIRHGVLVENQLFQEQKDILTTKDLSLWQSDTT